MDIETNINPARIDHAWITLDIGGGDRFQIAINTLSTRNRDSGFDSRIRVGILRGVWTELPAAGVFDSAGLDYLEIEKCNNVFYEHCGRLEMEQMITRKSGEAILVEAWGEVYIHLLPGIHQVHSRRASSGVPEDIVGRDGGLKYYYSDDNRSEMLLFKFCGQP